MDVCESGVAPDTPLCGKKRGGGEVCGQYVDNMCPNVQHSIHAPEVHDRYEQMQVRFHIHGGKGPACGSEVGVSALSCFFYFSFSLPPPPPLLDLSVSSLLVRTALRENQISVLKEQLDVSVRNGEGCRVMKVVYSG